MLDQLLPLGQTPPVLEAVEWLYLNIAEVTNSVRYVAAGILATDGIRRFIRAGRSRHKAAFLHRKGKDDGAEQDGLLQSAALATLVGAMETTAAAGLTGSYHYMATESLLVMTSLLTYLRDRISMLQTPVADRIRSILPYLELLHPLFRTTIEQVIISTGATFLGTAFRMETDTQDKEVAYQKRSFVGGALYALGSLVDAVTNPLRSAQVISSWFVLLNAQFSGNALANLRDGGKKEKRLHLSAPDYPAPLTEMGTINFAMLNQQPTAVAECIRGATDGESLSGENLTRRIMAILFADDAIGQEVPLQQGEHADAIPEGQMRVVSACGRVIFTSIDSNTPPVSTLGPQATPADRANDALSSPLGFALQIDREIELLARRMGYEGPMTPEVKSEIVGWINEALEERDRCIAPPEQ